MKISIDDLKEVKGGMKVVKVGNFGWDVTFETVEERRALVEHLRLLGIHHYAKAIEQNTHRNTFLIFFKIFNTFLEQNGGTFSSDGRTVNFVFDFNTVVDQSFED